MSFPMHLIGMLRMCGASSIPTGLNTNVLVNGILAAVVGDRDNHNNLGPILKMLDTRVMINNIPAVPAIASGALPDIIGITPHLQGFPIPIQGSQNVKIGQGSMAGALGFFGLSGNLQVGELVSFGQQIIGQVMAASSIGGVAGVAQIGNLSPGAYVSPGQTLVGQTSGHTFTPIAAVDTRPGVYPSIDSSLGNVLTNENGDYITLECYETLSPVINLTSTLVTT